MIHGKIPSDPSYDHLAVQKNGDLNHNGANNLVPFTGFPPGNSNIEDGLWHNVVFSWNPNTYNFKVVYDGVTLVNYTNNIVTSIFGNNPNVYWGFTAATGGANNIQQFRVNSLGVQLSDETICYLDTIQIDPQVNTSLYSYLWTPNYDISNDTIPSPLFSPDTSTTYYLEITNSYGCLQTDSLTINVDNSTTSTDNVGNQCDTYAWLDGNTYTASNNSATWTTTNAAGCENVATLNLTINNSTTSIDPQIACDSYTWIDGVTYTTSNNSATWTTTNAAGCENVATLNLTINNSTTSIDPQIACDSYTWIDGVTYTTSNNSATWTTTNAAGCENVATLNLTINNSTTSIDPQIACDSYTWIDGVTYTTSNNSATWTTTNAAGCENVATLNLTINNSTTSIDPQIACDSYTWIDGVTYTTSNNSATWTTTNAAGCENVATLNLTINNSTTSIDPQIACDSYTWIDGVTYTTSNNSATWTTTNAAGCENVATLNLTINNSTTSIDPQIACDSYTWIDGVTYTTSNNSATFTSTNAAGCR